MVFNLNSKGFYNTSAKIEIFVYMCVLSKLVTIEDTTRINIKYIAIETIQGDRSKLDL